MILGKRYALMLVVPALEALSLSSAMCALIMRTLMSSASAHVIMTGLGITVNHI